MPPRVFARRPLAVNVSNKSVPHWSPRHQDGVYVGCTVGRPVNPDAVAVARGVLPSLIGPDLNFRSVSSSSFQRRGVGSAG